MNSTVVAMPIAASGPGPQSDQHPAPFQQGVRDVLDHLAAEMDPRGRYTDLLAEATAAITSAHGAELTLARRRVVRGEREAAAALERSRAYEMVAEHVKAAATHLIDQNARLHAHVARQTAQLQAVFDLLAAAPGDGSTRTVRVTEVLAAVDQAGKPYEWPAAAPFIAGMAIDDRHHVGHFVGLKGERTSHLFMGWAVVIHSELQSVIEALFRVNGRPVPESQLSLSGWRLESLR